LDYANIDKNSNSQNNTFYIRPNIPHISKVIICNGLKIKNENFHGLKIVQIFK